MKTKTVYKCDVCGTEYSSEIACNRCENSHKVKYENVEQDRYSRMKAYPDSITLHFEDDPEDKFVIYSYAKWYTYNKHKEDKPDE